MAKRKTARPAGRARGRRAAAGRTAAASGRKRGTKSSSTRGARTRTKIAAGSRKAAAGTRSTGGGARKTRKRPAATRKSTESRPKPRASGARSTRPGAKRTASASAKALRRRQSRATGGAKKRPAATTRKAATSRAGRSTSTAPRESLGKRGRHSRRAAIERDRRLLEETVATPPSSLDFPRKASAARSGRAELEEALAEHTETGPALTGGDIDADWQSAYGTGDEAPGGDMPTPDKSVVEDIGKALGVEYQDNEELKGVDKVEERDRHRWEFDPASSEDYQERSRRK